jgi:hypothetical protein
MKRKINFFTFIGALIISLPSFGQLSNVGSMLGGSTEDAEKLLQAYFKPYGNAFGANLNGAWYNTAKTHKLGGFDLTFSISASFVPKADKEFDASQLGLSAAATVDPANKISPTIAGSKTTGAKITYPALNNLSYNLPKGTGWSVIPSPMFQLGIGLVKETDLTFRYVPSLSVGDFGKVGLWGVGLKHSLKQYIPAIKELPFFHLSLFLGYTQMKTSADISFQPDFYNNYMEPDPVDKTTLDFDNQKMEMTFKSFTTSILASFDLPVITVYGGLGFATNNTNLDLKGDYPLLNVNGSTVEITDGKKDPLNIKITSSSGAKPRLTGGIKFKMGVITYHVDYTYANYSIITTGLGLSFR